MSLSATATAQADWSPPRVEIAVTAGSPLVNGALVTCDRIHPNGSRWPVITQSNLRLSSLSALFWDNHPPRNVPVTYEVAVDAETATATPTIWQATDPNVMPVDSGTGGEARMLEWYRSTGGRTVNAVTATLAPGETITARGIPVAEGETYGFGVNTSGDATAGLQFRSGLVALGLPAETSTTGSDRPVVVAEAPAEAGVVDASVTNDSGGSITVSLPTLLIGTDYPAEAAPTQVASGVPLVVDVDPDEVWLIHRSTPSLSVRVDMVAAITPFGHQPTVGTFSIPNRANPVHISGGVMHGGQGEIDVRCNSDASVKALADLLADAGPIVIATPGTEGWDMKWEWVQPVGWSMTNPAGLVGYRYRHVMIQVEQTDQPVVAGGGLRTYAQSQVMWAGMSYGDVSAQYASYRDRRTDTRIP